MKFNFSPTIFYLIFIIPAICDAHHYKIGDQSDDILFFNVGQKHKNKNFAVSLSHEYRFGLPELAVTGLNLEYRMRNVQSSLGLYSSGDDIYRENRILLTSSRVLSIVNVHHGISYDQIAIKGYNSITSNSGIVAIGLMPHSKWLLTVGSNFDIDDSNSSSKKFGKLWINSVAFVRPQTILCGAVESNPYSVTTISLGLQEIISERLAVCLSFRDNPMSLGGALTITRKRLEFNISVQNNLPLGWVNRFEISFK